MTIQYVERPIRDYWCIVDSKGCICQWTFGADRARAIEYYLRHVAYRRWLPQTWKAAYRWGYRARRCRVTVERAKL